MQASAGSIRRWCWRDENKVSIRVKSKASRAKPQSAQRTTGKSDTRFNSSFASLRLCAKIFLILMRYGHIYRLRERNRFEIMAARPDFDPFLFLRLLRIFAAGDLSPVSI
jgi:hypothetical protein